MYRFGLAWTVFLGAILIKPVVARAFPEMVRMGYPNCVSCHVSPSGGGVLTEYGRSMASEVLSAANFEGEEEIGHGLIKTSTGPFKEPPWFRAGGDLRLLQSYLDTPRINQKRFFLMQADLELAVRTGLFWLVGAAGVEGGPDTYPDRGKFISREHYAMYTPTEETYVRAGRFMVPFGIEHPNHTLFTRGGLGWDQARETYNLEAGYIGEKYNVSLTGDFGRVDRPDQVGERGAALSLSSNQVERSKLGASVFRGTSDGSDRWLAGPWAIFGLSKTLVWMGEAYWQWVEPKSGREQKGPVAANILQYEFKKGIHGYLIQQYSYLDLESTASRTDSWGAGFAYYPRPHFEVSGEWDKQHNTRVGGGYYDSAWLLLHYYL